MKTVLIHLLFYMTITFCTAQDYYAVVKKNENITYNYPVNSSLNLFDANGTKFSIEKGEALTVSGNYRLEVTVPWKDTPDVVMSDGGVLEIYSLDKKDKMARNGVGRANNYNYNVTKDYVKPNLKKKTVTHSVLYPETYNINLVFTNGITFSYVDGVVRAYENGNELDIVGSYTITGTDETLKVSYDPKTAELWYVFEKSKK